MIHGIISDASFFEKAASYLADEFQVITYDRCGYGAYADRETADYSVEAQAEEAARIIKRYAPEGAWIFGNSAGGLIAIALCLKYPSLVKGMLLLEPSFQYDRQDQEQLSRWNKELNGYVKEKRIKKALLAFSSVVGESSAAERVTMEEMRRTYENLSAFMYGELNEVQHYTPPVKSLKAIEKPVRVIVTEKGKDRLFGRSSLSGAEILGWPVKVYPGNHNMVRELPQEAARYIKQDIHEMRYGDGDKEKHQNR